MDKSMNKTSFALGILAAVIGLMLVIAPTSGIRVVVILMGIGAFADGIVNLIKISKWSSDSQFHLAVIIRGWVSIVIGLLAVFLPLVMFNAVATVVRVMLYVLGVYLIISAISEIYLISKLHKEEVPTKHLWGEVAGSIIVAIILFLLPKNYGEIIVRILGVLLIVAGAAYSIYEWRNASLVVEPDSVKDDISSDDAASSTNDATVSTEETNASTDDVIASTKEKSSSGAKSTSKKTRSSTKAKSTSKK